MLTSLFRTESGRMARRGVKGFNEPGIILEDVSLYEENGVVGHPVFNSTLKGIMGIYYTNYIGLTIKKGSKIPKEIHYLLGDRIIVFSDLGQNAIEEEHSNYYLISLTCVSMYYHNNNELFDIIKDKSWNTLKLSKTEIDKIIEQSTRIKSEYEIVSEKYDEKFKEITYFNEETGTNEFKDGFSHKDIVI